MAYSPVGSNNLHPASHKSVQQQQDGGEHGHPGDGVAPQHVESNGVVEADIALDGNGLIVAGRLQDIAPLVDKGGNARIGGAGDVAPRFDGAQGSKMQVLAVAGGIVPPAVVGHDEDGLSAFLMYPVTYSPNTDS